MNIEKFLEQDQNKELLRFITCGSVDDGKSTLLGHLLCDTKQVYEDQLNSLQEDSMLFSHADGKIDYALLLDGLRAEKEQGITIDVAYRFFSTNKRKYIVADCPGHAQYTRNMITGGSTADVAVILIDATNGITEQTKLHNRIISLLGIKHVCACINKMDLVDYSEVKYKEIVDEYIQDLDFTYALKFIPVSALQGDNISSPSKNMKWYNDKTLLEYLESVSIDKKQCSKFRFPIQYVNKPNNDFRGYCGKIIGRSVSENDSVILLPSMKEATIDKVYSEHGVNSTITLKEDVDLSRGEMIVKKEEMPSITNTFGAFLVWMDDDPCDRNKNYYIKQTTNLGRCHIDFTQSVNLNEIKFTIIKCNKSFFIDTYKKCRETGSFIIIDPETNHTAGVGFIQSCEKEDKTDTTEYVDISKLNIPKEHVESLEKLLNKLNENGYNFKINNKNNI